MDNASGVGTLWQLFNLQALPLVRRECPDLPILVDSGFRRGTDVLKALALGARAVLIGRPVLWGLAVAGEEGVTDVLRMFQEEVESALGLLGCVSPAGVSRAHVR